METQSRRGIIRPNAQHLQLPLVEPNRFVYGSSGFIAGHAEAHWLAVPSSCWTLTAGPKSSASMYSQESYLNSPPIFCEARLDKRRFGIALSPSQDGPWRHLHIAKSPNSPAFVVALPSAELEKNSGAISVNQTSIGGRKEEVMPEAVVSKSENTGAHQKGRRDTTGNVKLKKMYTVAHSQASKSTKVFGKMFSRLSMHPSSHSMHATVAEEPLPSDLPHALSDLPPQILISLPSPGLDLDSDTNRPDGSEKDVPESHITFGKCLPGNRSTLPSTWKPKRPPSPLPRPLRRKCVHGRHNRSASTFATPHSVHSPIPPIPSVIIPRNVVLSESPKAMFPGFVGFPTPYLLHGPPAGIPPVQSATADNWVDVERLLQVRLRARAMKSATFAIHDGGIISPS